MWADAVPNLLIGLREGLEGGLVVSILLAAVRRAPAGAARSVWLGVLAALMLSLSFGAVLTFSDAELSTAAQDAFAGILSVIAVVLVTAMIFWMRRTARDLAGELNARVDVALAVGSGALAATAFLAVGREGLETALFLWTAVKASGDTTAPLIGGAVGIAVAAALCWLLYRRAIRINLGVFFRRTAVALIVIAGGVLAYGIGDLQESTLLPGRAWTAFDLTGSVSPDAWWVSIIRGVTNLTPAMTWTQVVAYVLYVGIVLAVFLLTEPAAAKTGERAPIAVGWAERLLARPWTSVAAAVLVPVLAAGVFALFGISSAAAATGQVTVTDDACAPEFTALAAGDQTFTVADKSGRPADVYFVRSTDGGILAEAENIGPGTQRTLRVSVAAGSYQWRCDVDGTQRQSTAVRTSGGRSTVSNRMFAVPPLQPDELDVPIQQYQEYVSAQLGTLAGQVDTLRSALGAGDLAAARAAWLPAQLTWERVGAAYGSFGNLADAVDGAPDGLPDGVRDKDFTGLRRLEYGLWHNQPAAELAPIAAKLSGDVAQVRATLATATVDPKDMVVRAHEIIEDAQRDHLSGMTNQGADSGFAETLADVDATGVVLDELAPLIEERKHGLVATVKSDLDTLRQALEATRHGGVWDGVTTAPLAERQRVNAAVGQELEDISPVPDLLEIGAS